MKKLSFYAWAVMPLLLADPALANHCDANFDDAQAAIDNAYSLEPNVEDTVAALLPAAIEACRLEEQAFATAEVGSPKLEPDYVSVGQSMLINVTQLVSGQ
jgi:hypothetical protein